MGWTSFYFIAFGLHCGFAVLLVGARALTVTSVPCGDTFCQQPGYETCLLPPKVMNAYCCPCGRFEDPCNMVTPQQGCHLFCQDKVFVERDKKCNKTMADALEKQSQDLRDRTQQDIIERDKKWNKTMAETLTKQRQDLGDGSRREIGKYRAKVMELERRMKILVVVGVAGFTGVLALIALVAGTLFYLCRRRLKTKPGEGPSVEPENPEHVSTGKLLHVKFDLTWTACTRFFDFDVDLPPDTLADAIARESWSRHFFDTLKTIHQTHYEQFGDTRGTVTIEGHDPVTLNIRGIRDHSYGNIRNWRQLHRYCIQYASFEDGTNLNISAISMPTTTSRLHCGFLFLADGQLESVTWTDLEFHCLGDDGTPVNKFTVKFKAGGRMRTLEAEVLDWRQFYIGEGRDAKIYERYVRYRLDGVEGYGLSEWEYVNTDGTEPQNNMGLTC